MTSAQMNPQPPLSALFFDRDPVLVARELLGATLVHTPPGGEVLSGRVVETEAYDCPRDPACTAGRFHAARSADMATAPGRWLFWAALAFALAVAFVVTVPVNRWMIGRGRGHAVVHAYHH